MPPQIGNALGFFHNKVIQRLTGQMPHRRVDRVSKYPPLGDVMVTAGLQDIETYIYRRQNTVTQYIVTRTIMDMCIAAGRHLGTQILGMWWEQENLNM